MQGTAQAGTSAGMYLCLEGYLTSFLFLVSSYSSSPVALPPAGRVLIKASTNSSLSIPHTSLCPFASQVQMGLICSLPSITVHGTPGRPCLGTPSQGMI